MWLGWPTVSMCTHGGGPGRDSQMHKHMRCICFQSLSSKLAFFLVVVLQASTNTLLAHFLSVVFANCIIGLLSKAKGRPAAA